MKPVWVNMRDDRDTIDFTDATVEHVNHYIKWLYSETLSITLYKADSKETKEKVAKEAEKVFIQLAEAYTLGERIIDIRYKNVILKTIVRAISNNSWKMGPESVRIAYMGTPSESPLRRVIADAVAYSAVDDSNIGVEFGWMKFFDEYPQEALSDALKAMTRVRKMVGAMPSIKSYLEKEGC